MMAEVRWTKKKPILNLSSQVPSTASLATVRSPAPDAGTINEQVFFLSTNLFLWLNGGFFLEVIIAEVKPHNLIC